MEEEETALLDEAPPKPRLRFARGLLLVYGAICVAIGITVYSLGKEDPTLPLWIVWVALGLGATMLSLFAFSFHEPALAFRIAGHVFVSAFVVDVALATVGIFSGMPPMRLVKTFARACTSHWMCSVMREAEEAVSPTVAANGDQP